jgi:protein-S-isoprenylcysteine O-methyltransferase Ste14
MDIIILLVTLGAEILTLLAVTFSIIFPDRRIWPPNRPSSWGQYLMVLLFLISAGGGILTGIIDWGQFVLPLWFRITVGVPLWLGGSALALWAMAVLKVAMTSGNEGMLLQHGPYGISRNPQYVGFIAGLFGWAVTANSIHTLIVAVAGMIPLILVPFAEEPWLLGKYGAVYAEYKRKVPRFIGFIQGGSHAKTPRP